MGCISLLPKAIQKAWMQRCWSHPEFHVCNAPEFRQCPKQHCLLPALLRHITAVLSYPPAEPVYIQDTRKNRADPSNR